MITILQGSTELSIVSSEVAAVVVTPFDKAKWEASHPQNADNGPEVEGDEVEVVPAPIPLPTDTFSKLLLKNGMTMRVSEADARKVVAALAA